MCSVRLLREFVRQRLAAAAEEIFSEVERTIGRLEEELAAQRRLLAVCLKPQVRLQRLEQQQQLSLCKEAVLIDSPDPAEPEPPLVEGTEPESLRTQPGQEEPEPEPSQLPEPQPEPEVLFVDDTGGEPEPVQNLDQRYDSEPPPDVLSDPDRPRIIDDLGELEYLDFDGYLDDPESPQVIDDLDETGLLEPEPEREEPESQNKTRKVEFWTRHDDEGLLLRKEFNTFVPRPRKSKVAEPAPESPDGVQLTEVQQNQVNSEHGPDEENQDFSLDLTVPERTGIKQERDDAASGQAGLRQEADIFMVTVNYDESEHSEAEPSSSQQSEDSDESKPFVCKTCGKRFSNMLLLHDHRDTHQKEKPYSCQLCTRRFARRDSAFRHMITHTGEKPFPCQICGEKFGLNSHLLRHLRRHTGEKPFSCHICHKRFSQSNTLTCHVRTHTGEKPYPCRICGKGFVRRSAMNIHMRMHTGEKPFTCKVCDKTFSRGTGLSYHMRTHTGEKPYSCKLCGRTFRQSSHLMCHMRNSHLD